MSRNKAKGRGWTRHDGRMTPRMAERAARRALARREGALRLGQLARPGYGQRIGSLSERSRHARVREG